MGSPRGGRVDLRDQIFIDLDTLQGDLKKSREKYEEAVKAAEGGNAQIVELQETIGNLKRLLDGKERTITAFRTRMESLEKEAAELKEE